MTGIKSIFRKKLSSWLRAGLFLLAFTLMPLLSTNAAIPVADSPCDPEYFKSLKSRAWLEAQREITQNQNLIFKPDSVLEYTCFSGQLAQLARNAPLMFSENPRWGLSIGNMAGALTNLVYSATSSYLVANFSVPSPNLLGGRADDPAITAPLVPNLTQAYSCDIMNKVWTEAKCMDFIDDAEHDGFYTFDQYAGFGTDDRRFLPAACLGVLNADGTNKWETELEVALDDDITSWEEDVVTPYIAELHPNFCTSISDGGTGSGATLNTGLIVRTKGGATFPEKVCVPPGCHYDYPSRRCVSN